MRKTDYLRKINELMLHNKFLETESLIFDIIRNYEEPWLYYYLGVAQIELNKFDHGIDNLLRSIFLDKDFDLKNARNILAKIYMQNSQFSLAEKFTIFSIACCNPSTCPST